MRQKTGFGCRNPVDLVSKYIGTSYDVVKLVADNIDILESISINIDGILEIGDNIDDISIVANNIEEVVLVGQNIDNLEEVILHIDDISLINDNITDVVTVADNIDHIIFLAESISNPTLIDRVDDLESRVDILEDTSLTHTNQINLQSGYIQDLQTNVSSNSIDIDSLDTRVTEVETLSQNTSDTLVNHIVDYNSNKSSVDAKFIEVENDIQANADAIAAWEEYDDTALSGRVTILEDDLDSLTIEVANNKDAIDNFENYDDAELRGRVETNELDITNLEDVVNNLDGLSPADRAKFDGIEDGATADQTGAEIKAAYEAEPDTNAYTDADKVLVDGAVQSLTGGSNVIVGGLGGPEDNNLYISVTPSASIGLTNHVYITGDTETTTEGTFYTTSNLDRGTVAEVELVATVNDGESDALPSQLLSIVYPDDAVLPAGTYEGNLSISSSSGNAQLSILQELYLTDPQGVIIDSGLEYMEIGSLGVRPIVNLQSGIFELSVNDINNVPVAGIIREQVSALANNRAMYNTIITKENNAGGSVNVSVFIGSDHNSYLNSISPISSDNLVNSSDIIGATVTDALNVLNDNKIDEAPLDGNQYARQDGNWVEVEGGGSSIAPVGDIKIVQKDEVVLGYDSLEETWFGDKSTDQILHSKYYTRGGNFTEIESNTIGATTNKIVRIHEYDDGSNLYYYFENNMGYIFKDFENRSDITEVVFVDSTGASMGGFQNIFYIASLFNESIVILQTSTDFLYKYTMDYTLATTSEIAASISMVYIDCPTDFGLAATEAYPTRNGIMVKVGTYDYKLVDWDLNSLSAVDVSLSGVPYISDGSREKYILYNGGVLSRGRVYTYDGIAVIDFGYSDHRQSFSCVHSNGLDIISTNNNVTTYGVINPDGSGEVRNFDISTSLTILSYADENNMILGTFSYGKYYTHEYKDGVITVIPRRDLESSTSYNNLFRGHYYNQFTRPTIIGMDETDNSIAYLMTFLTEVPDNFQIEAIPTNSDDKKYIIKTESAMLRDGVE